MASVWQELNTEVTAGQRVIASAATALINESM